jgi:hypothetical protein
MTSSGKMSTLSIVEPAAGATGENPGATAPTELARVIPAVSCELHASYLRPTPAPRWAGSGHGVGHGVVPVIHHSDTTNDCGSVRTVPQSSPVIVISGFTSNPCLLGETTSRQEDCRGPSEDFQRAKLQSAARRFQHLRLDEDPYPDDPCNRDGRRIPRSSPFGSNQPGQPWLDGRVSLRLAQPGTAIRSWSHPKRLPLLKRKNYGTHSGTFGRIIPAARRPAEMS